MHHHVQPQRCRSSCQNHGPSSIVRQGPRSVRQRPPPPLLASIDSVTFCALTFRLEEMHEYCENALSCRRQTFSDKFTETRSRLNRCGRMCDNCKHQGGAARRTFLPPKPGVTVLENVKATTTTTTTAITTAAATRPTGNTGKRNYSRLIEDEEVDDDGWIAAKAPRPTTVDGGNPTAASITSKPAAPPKAGFVKASMWTGAPSSSSSSSKQPSTSAALQSSEHRRTVATNAMLPSRSFLYEDSDDEDLTYLQATTTKPSTATRPTAVGRSTFANTKTNAICIDDDDDDHDDVVDTGGRPPLAARFQKASQLRR